MGLRNYTIGKIVESLKEPHINVYNEQLNNGYIYKEIKEKRKDRFYKNLEFRIARFRWVISYRTNRINKYTVRRELLV